MRRRSIIPVGLGALCLGLITSVGVAWGSALWGSAPRNIVFLGDVAGSGLWFGLLSEGGGQTQFMLGRLEKGDRLTFRVALPEGNLDAQAREYVVRNRDDSFRLPAGTDWVKVEPSLSGEASSIAGVFWSLHSDGPGPASAPPWMRRAVRASDIPVLEGVAAGWPIRCLGGWNDTYGHGPPDEAMVHWLLSPRARSSGPSRARRELPILPVWPGLIVNTVFWGLAWALLIGTGVVLVRNRRSARRRRRGWCVRCGYDLLGEYEKGCPECGWGRARDR